MSSSLISRRPYTSHAFHHHADAPPDDGNTGQKNPCPVIAQIATKNALTSE
jgi:hypothetical protein